MTHVHAIVSGRVQGVGYRYTLQAVAQRAGVTGWVRNLADGTVETRLSGTTDAIDTVLAWMADGPRGGRVDQVRATPATAVETTGFEIRADG